MHVAARLLRELTHHAEAEARAALLVLRREERLEHALLKQLRDTATIICYGDTDVAPGRNAALFRTTFVDTEVASRYRD